MSEIERIGRQLADAKADAAGWKKLAESALELARIGASMAEIDKLLSTEGAPVMVASAPRPLPFDAGYVHAYLKAALLSVEPEGCTDPQAAYFLDWLEQVGTAEGVKGQAHG